MDKKECSQDSRRCKHRREENARNQNRNQRRREDERTHHNRGWSGLVVMMADTDSGEEMKDVWSRRQVTRPWCWLGERHWDTEGAVQTRSTRYLSTVCVLRTAFCRCERAVFERGNKSMKLTGAVSPHLGHARTHARTHAHTRAGARAHRDTELPLSYRPAHHYNCTYSWCNYPIVIIKRFTILCALADKHDDTADNITYICVSHGNGWPQSVDRNTHYRSLPARVINNSSDSLCLMTIKHLVDTTREDVT